jgi:hypothetical protein
MLPNSHDGPACFLQRPGDFPISLAVPGQLGTPVICIGPRDGPVGWTAMPETPINENSHLASTKHKVGANSNISRYHREVSPIAQPATMENGAKF